MSHLPRRTEAKMGHVLARSQLILSRTLKMESHSKRPTCPSCAKPTQLCLCKRMRSPCLDNQVSVTILQHCLERKHALNSARIARLGLKNVTLTTVCDVHHQAEFVIRVIGSATTPLDSLYRLENRPNCSKLGSTKLESEKKVVLVDDHGSLEIAPSLNFSHHFRQMSCLQKDFIRISMNQKGVICNVSHSLMLETHVENPTFDQILASPAAMDVMAKGFVVTKFSEGKPEFELEVPPGSALLFPSKQSVKISDLKVRDLKLTNLIVLDGTWSKAKRMYLENPWLKLLHRHVKLELEGTSLYGEVRRQPRTGCLSTIESIVHTMKEIGEDPESLDNMLDVFESMVNDQRRCKEENFGKC